jgi:hypothetical protein
MHVAVYTLALTSVDYHHPAYIDNVLKYYFCPLFSAHGLVDTLAVCEDKKYQERGEITFKYYEDFLHSPHSKFVVATIQEHGDIDQKLTMIQKIVRIMEETEGSIIVLSNYYN